MDTKRVLNALISSQRIMVNELALLRGENREAYGKVNHWLDIAQQIIIEDEASETKKVERSTIKLSNYEIQSGLNRVQIAENLIQQLPEDHDGRNTWLLNYGKGAEGDYLRRNHNHAPIWDFETESLIHYSKDGECEMSLLKQIDLAQEVFSSHHRENEIATQVIMTQKTANLVSEELKANSGSSDLVLTNDSELFNMTVVIDEDVDGIEFVVV